MTATNVNDIRRDAKLAKLRPWRSTGRAAEVWDALRRRMSPAPKAAAFIALCDSYADELERRGCNCDPAAIAAMLEERTLEVAHA